MVKKLREYKRGDFIFAKVKGYPAWPARVKGVNGKKYFVHFYGTGETANLAANVLFDYEENKEKLTKNVKRKFFSEGVQQIEYDFTNKVALDDADGVPAQPSTSESMDDSGTADTTINDTADTTANDTAEDTAADTTAAVTALADESMVTNENDTAVEDSDDGALVIDETKKPKAKKPRLETSTPKPAKEKPEKEKPEKEKVEKDLPTPKEKETREPKTPRGQKRAAAAEVEEKKESKEEVISRSGRKIRPKRYLEEVAEEPTPAKRRHVASPADKPADKPEKPVKLNFLNQSELQDISEPLNDESEGASLRHVLLARRPDGRYVGVRLFEERPASLAGDALRDWMRADATRAIQLKRDIESGKVKTKEAANQLVLDLNLSSDEKLNLNKEWELEEKRFKMAYLSTEFALIEQDAKIKTCINLERADPDQCLALLDELLEMDVQPLMLLKHPTCLETIKRLRCYVGNVGSWELSEEEKATFNKKAHLIRNKSDKVYNKLKDLFTTPDDVTFWEYFSQRVMQFKQCTAEMVEDEIFTLVREPTGMTSQPDLPPLSPGDGTDEPAAGDAPQGSQEKAEERESEEKAEGKGSEETAEGRESEEKAEGKGSEERAEGKGSEEKAEGKGSEEKAEGKAAVAPRESPRKRKDASLEKRRKSNAGDKPEKPDKSEKSDKSDKPEKTDKTDKTDKSSKSDKVEKLDKSHKSDKADKSDKVDKSDKSDKIDKSDKSDKAKSDKSEKADKYDKTEKSDKNGKSDKLDKSDKNDKSDKQDKSDKLDKADKPEKSERSERTLKRQSSRKAAESEEGDKKNGKPEEGDKEEKEVDSGRSKRETRESKESAKKTESAAKTPAKRKLKS